MNSESGHDFIKDGKYNKVCACVKCTKTYDKWCKKNKEDGATICRRKRVVHEEIVCEKPVTTVYNWGHKNIYEGKWEAHRPEPLPRNCDSCKKPASKCGCSNKGHKKHDKFDLDFSLDLSLDRDLSSRGKKDFRHEKNRRGFSGY